MYLVVDQNIPLASEAFSQFGSISLVDGRNLKPEQLREAEALIVRSVTKVNRALLEGSRVRFVGTATIGMDHIDLEYLRDAGIGFASAQGCNARSVVEWVLAALAEWCVAHGEDWEGKTLGIIGHGNIGARLAVRARGVGMRVLVNDPPLARREEHHEFVDLETVLTKSDFVTLHVPLTREGEDATYHLIGARELEMMREGAVLLNASRGQVLDNGAALAVAGRIGMILDVFENEPRPSQDLIRRCFLATPHIAGYSFEGKVNGTRMMAVALARFRDRTSSWAPELPVPEGSRFRLKSSGLMQATLEAMRHSYPIRSDDARLREGIDWAQEDWGRHFDALRKHYPQRREFANYKVDPMPEDQRLAGRLRVLHLL
jgi:erythronate-4-phosphate dehydrogenase